VAGYRGRDETGKSPAYRAGGDALAEGSHGPRWQAAMARLGREGEAWVEEDLRNMAEVPADEERLLTRIVAEMAQLDPRLDFSSAVEALSKSSRGAGANAGASARRT